MKLFVFIATLVVASTVSAGQVFDVGSITTSSTDPESRDLAISNALFSIPFYGPVVSPVYIETQVIECPEGWECEALGPWVIDMNKLDLIARPRNEAVFMWECFGSRAAPKAGVIRVRTTIKDSSGIEPITRRHSILCVPPNPEITNVITLGYITDGIFGKARYKGH